jgi:hypothetical protein
MTRIVEGVTQAQCGGVDGDRRAKRAEDKGRGELKPG